MGKPTPTPKGLLPVGHSQPSSCSLALETNYIQLCLHGPYTRSVVRQNERNPLWAPCSFAAATEKLM
jgi:hypothetical protein